MTRDHENGFTHARGYCIGVWWRLVPVPELRCCFPETGKAAGDIGAVPPHA